MISGGGLMYQTDNEKSGGTYPMDNKKFGEFIAQLRKEKHLTQKELAERLFISDKAVVSDKSRESSVRRNGAWLPVTAILNLRT